MPVVLYEVNLAVDAEIADACAAWLRPHIAEILRLDGFMGAEWFELEPHEADGDARVHWCVQYRLPSREALQTYFDEHAARLRGDGMDRFAGRFEASRRVMTERAQTPA